MIDAEWDQLLTDLRSLDMRRALDAIKGLEDGSLKLDGTDSQAFFKLILTDTQTGFLADPIYGGNRDLASWKMIGFPGANYDYRDWIDRHNQRVTLPVVGMANHPNWSQ